jgi:hypothetical protein
MSNCWSEGDLRAALDGELDATSAARLTAHLAECTSCQALRQELAGRASRVAGMMAALEESAPATIIPMPPIRPVAPILTWRAVAAIGAIAAGLAIIALTVPHRATSKLTQDANATTPNPVASRKPSVVPAQPVSLTHPRHRLLRGPEQRAAVLTPVASPAVAEPAGTNQGYFLALDDEPIETGIVMRVASPSGDFQADVIVGPDGRAHAIRIVTDDN